VIIVDYLIESFCIIALYLSIAFALVLISMLLVKFALWKYKRDKQRQKAMKPIDAIDFTTYDSKGYVKRARELREYTRGGEKV
jgi:hypothetical protein